MSGALIQATGTGNGHASPTMAAIAIGAAVIVGIVMLALFLRNRKR